MDKVNILTEQSERMLQALTSRKPVHHAVIAVESGNGSFPRIGTAGEAQPRDAVAILLGQLGYNVLVLDRARFPSDTLSIHFFRYPTFNALHLNERVPMQGISVR
jgi:hypothetical protein